jgi:hypothetical protein
VPSRKRSSPSTSRTADPFTSNQPKLPFSRRSRIVTASTSVPEATSIQADVAFAASSRWITSSTGTPTSAAGSHPTLAQDGEA